MNKPETFLRFVVLEPDRRTESLKGLFTVAYDLSRSHELQDYEVIEINHILVWFEKNLPTPTKFSRTKNIGQREAKGISWIRATAKEATSRLHQLKEIVERHGFHCSVLKSSRPGYVVYQDKYQVVAEPFRKEAG